MKVHSKKPDVPPGSMCIVVRFQFAAVHYRPDALRKSILRVPHRHVFHVTATKSVSHDDRDIEFIELKTQMEKAAVALYGKITTTNSCEMMARTLGTMYRCRQVSVLEDNENGAMWTYDPLATLSSEREVMRTVRRLAGRMCN